MKAKPIGIADILGVLAVVAVTAAIAAPMLGSAYGQNGLTPAQQQSQACASNLKQLGLAMAMYTQYYDEHLPSGANWYGSGSGWAQQVFPYVKSVAVFHCPSDTNKSDVISYGYNSNLVRLTGYVPSAPIGQGLAASSAPAATVLMFEVANNGSQGMSPGYLVTDGSSPFNEDARTDIHPTGKRLAPFDGWSPGGRGLGSYVGELSGMGDDRDTASAPLMYATGPMLNCEANQGLVTATGRHQGRSNFAFLDDHVKSELPTEVSAGRNNPIPGSVGGDGKAANASSAQTATFSLL